MSLPAWIKEQDGAAQISIAAQPSGKRNEILGLHGGALKIRLAAPPVDGAANEALIGFLASLLGVKRRDVAIVRGATGRQKVVRIEGLNINEIAAILEAARQD